MNYIRGFKNFMVLCQSKNEESNSGSKINETKDYPEISKDPLIYKGYYLTIWPFRNEERHPEKKWGFTISKDPEGKDYISKTRGPAGNYQECLTAGQDQIENFISRG